MSYTNPNRNSKPDGTSRAPRLRERREVVRMDYFDCCHRAGFHDFRCMNAPAKPPARRMAPPMVWDQAVPA